MVEFETERMKASQEDEDIISRRSRYKNASICKRNIYVGRWFERNLYIYLIIRQLDIYHSFSSLPAKFSLQENKKKGR